VSRPALGPTKPPIRWVPGALSLGTKRPGREADHSPPSSAEVKECVELYFHSLHTSSWRGAPLKYRDKFLSIFKNVYMTQSKTVPRYVTDQCFFSGRTLHDVKNSNCLYYSKIWSESPRGLEDRTDCQLQCDSDSDTLRILGSFRN
jgi:hypothetical protein